MEETVVRLGEAPVRATALRVAVVGARRRVQGTGEFAARSFAALGCRVAAIVGTTDETLAEALRNLEALDCRGYLSLGKLLEAEEIDAVAICSPPESHREHLEVALAAGCHVFCEKPLLWPVRGARELVEGFARRGLALALNAQWPFTLPAFEALHPGVLAAAERFELRLAPASEGTRMVVDSGSHFLSLLHAIAGPGSLEATRVRSGGPGKLELATTYRGARRRLEATLRLERHPAPPRPAGYSVNGRSVERRIEPPYRLSFETPDGRRRELADPTHLAIEDFVRAIEARRGPDVAALVSQTTQLEELAQAAARAREERA